MQVVIGFAQMQQMERATTAATHGDIVFKHGDHVEFRRCALAGNRPHWTGPATYHCRGEGQHEIRWQGQNVLVRTQNLRRAFTYPTFLMHTGPWCTVVSYVENMQDQLVRLGWLLRQGHWCAEADSSLSNIQVASHGLCFRNCIGARVGHSVPILEHPTDVGDTLLVWWIPGHARTTCHCEIRGAATLNMAESTADWQHVCIVQFLSAGDTDTAEITADENEATLCDRGQRLPDFPRDDALHI